MDQIFVAQQKKILTEEENRLESEITVLNKYPESGDDSMDDDAQEVEELNNANATENQLKKELKIVKLALARIESGEYGKCIQCGTDIDPKRLEAFPAANKCIQCLNK